MASTQFLVSTGMVAVLLGAGLVLRGAGQIPATFQNLQHFPRDIPRDDLVQRMREFSFALGVRCQYCHAGGDGVSFEGVKFESDEKPAKQKARFMLRMVDDLNGRLLPGVPARATPPVRVACVTCHRGSPLPRTLEDELARVIATEGAEAAAGRYRDLRRDTAHLGRYNFGEWSVNELVRVLWREQKNLDAAITMLRLNAEFYPKSVDIDLMLGEVYAEKGDKDKAIASFKTALEKQPNNPRAKQRLAELMKQ
jgi:tetratricopeptide (TPR) repeat protein